MTDDVRLEKDTFGEIAVPNAKLWGAQTQRSLQNFKISSEKQSPELIDALAIVKRASAEVNAGLKVLATDKAQAIIAVSQAIGKFGSPAQYLWNVPFNVEGLMTEHVLETVGRPAPPFTDSPNRSV